MNFRRALVVLGAVILWAAASEAQPLTIYDDALQNSFMDASYVFAGSRDFNSTAQPRTGVRSIQFVGDNYGAIVFDRTALPNLSTATYPMLRFWVHGGGTGAQQLRVLLQRDGVYFGLGADVDSYITGGAVAASTFREVAINLTQPPFSAGDFDRIEIQSDTGPPQDAAYIDDVSVGPVAIPVAAPLAIEHDIIHVGMSSDKFTWRDSAIKPRIAILAHNTAADTGPRGARGGAMREYQYQLPNGATRILTLTNYFGDSVGDAGFGYVVMHAATSFCGLDDSPIGGLQVGNGFERVFEGRHHAIFRFRQNYPRNCASNATMVQRTIPVTIDWIFSTGRDHPVWAITYDVDELRPAGGGAVAPAGSINDDSRAPYGELNIDGEGFASLDGVAWGDRYKFTTTGATPATTNSEWNWTPANTVPYLKEWINGPLGITNNRDATVGVVQTQTMQQQDAAGGRHGGAGSMTLFWQQTSPPTLACGGLRMPCGDDWPYQSYGNSIDADGSNNARMAWKTQYGFIGQTTYTTFNGLNATATGYPKKSYSTHIVFGTHTSLPVEAQLTQVETVQNVTFTPAIGSVVTIGPAGVTRLDNMTYQPAGYNHVYGALAFNAAGNQLDMNVNVGAGTLKKPLIIVGSYTAGDPQLVKFAGVTLTADADYFASVRAAASELWITLNRDLTGAVNRLEITGGGLGTPTNFVATAGSPGNVALSWTAVASAVNYEIHRSFLNSAYTLLTTIAAPGTTHDDVGLTADRTYLYKVRTLGPGGPSAFSPVDPATTILFTDDPLNAGTPAKAIHATQLRTAVNAMRAAAPGLAAQAFTDPGLAAGISIKRVHATELRTALDEARAAIGLTPLVYADPVITAGATTVKTAHVTNLRDGVK